jgi:di/tricarboxylate transporter
MTPDIILVLCILAGAVALFISEKLPIDMVALLALGAVLATGLVSAREAVSGFSNYATVTVASVFVLSAALQRSGAVAVLGRLLLRLGDSSKVLMVAIMIIVGVVSAFINNTAAVAVFLPLVIAVAARRKIAASRLLMPMSFASEFGGVCTLIGTSTNLLVSSISEDAGYGSFGMFEMGKLGLILCVAGVIYLVFVGEWLLPDRRGGELTETYELGGYITELRVMKGSNLIGKTVRESEFGKTEDVTVLQLHRGDKRLASPSFEPLSEGDVLLVEGKIKDFMDAKDAAGLEIAPEFELKDARLQNKDAQLVEALVAPRSRVIGRTLASMDFKRRHHVIVLALRRRNETLRAKIDKVPLQIGDELLLQGPEDEIKKLRGDGNFVMMGEVEATPFKPVKVALSVAILALVVGLAAMKIVPIVTAAILGCLAMLLTRCITLEEAYDAIDWRVIFLLGGILPLGIAMENSGAARWIAENTVQFVGSLGPYAVLAAFYVLTALLTETMSNNASAILLAPIAVSTAVAMGISPKPLLMAVTFAASTSFATPVGYQTNMMIYAPGGYRFLDFMKVGIPLIVIFCVISVFFIPRFWPF